MFWGLKLKHETVPQRLMNFSTATCTFAHLHVSCKTNTKKIERSVEKALIRLHEESLYCIYFNHTINTKSTSKWRVTVLFCFWEPDPPCSRCSFKRGLKQQTNNDDCHDPKISILCKSQLILSVLNEIKILSSFVLVIIVVLIYCICRNWILLLRVSTKISASLFFSNTITKHL